MRKPRFHVNELLGAKSWPHWELGGSVLRTANYSERLQNGAVVFLRSVNSLRVNLACPVCCGMQPCSSPSGAEGDHMTLHMLGKSRFLSQLEYFGTWRRFCPFKEQLRRIIFKNYTGHMVHKNSPFLCLSLFQEGVRSWLMCHRPLRFFWVLNVSSFCFLVPPLVAKLWNFKKKKKKKFL